VLRWEFRPGSILYAVWQQRRDDAENAWSPMAVFRQYQDMFSAHPNNTFVVKMSYWLNP